MAKESYPIKGVSRRYWSDADRMTLVSNLMKTAALITHGVAQRNQDMHLEEESDTLQSWAIEMMAVARRMDTVTWDV